MKRFWWWLDRALELLCALGCLVLVGVSFAGVIFRYAFNNSLVWSEELARYLFIWLIFLGAAIGVRERNHIAFDLFGSSLGPRGGQALEWLVRVATLAFAASLIVPGWRFVVVGMSNASPALEIPMGWVYLAPVVGGLLMSAYLFRPGAGGKGSNAAAPPPC